jgi:hypothetical protein
MSQRMPPSRLLGSNLPRAPSPALCSPAPLGGRDESGV